MEQCLREMTQITPKLYLSAQIAISDAALAKNNINLIINATKELPVFPPEDSSIKTIRVPVYDSADQNLYPYFKVAVKLNY